MVYKKFKLEDLFKSQTGDVDIKQKDLNGKGYMVVSSGQTNNGVIGKTDIESKIINGNTITVDMFGYSYYREDPYKTVTHARVFTLESLFDEMSAEIGLYFVSSFHFLPKIYNYSNMCSWNKIKDINISLPTLTNPDNTPVIDPAHKYHPEGYIPDWEYMQDYIKELEQDYIKELEQYLIVTGLNDYELTDEDREVLGQKIAERETSYQDRDNEDVIRNGREVKEFNVSNNNQTGLFNCFRGTRLTKQNRKPGSIPLLTAGNGIGEGVAEFINENKLMKKYKEDITIDMFGMAFYHDYEHYGDDNIHFLINESISELSKLFITSLINKKLRGVHSYGYQFRMKNLDELKLNLPVKLLPDNSPVIDPTHQYHPEGYVPDWEYMERYIKAIEKLVIKDVVKYKNKMIEKMKEVV